MNFEQARFNMIEQQVRPWDVLDQQVLDVIGTFPREDFVPEKYTNLAYSDIDIPLEHGHAMMRPTVEGRALQALAIQKKDTILEVGTGSGYLTACLAKLGQHVYSLDMHPDFTRAAAEKLKAHQITNVTLLTADATQTAGPQTAYDIILLTGSVPEISDHYRQALKLGGKLFAVVGRTDHPIMQAMLVKRISQTQWVQESLFETSLLPLEHTQQTQAFKF